MADDMTDGIADAIIGAVFLVHKVRQVGYKFTHPGARVKDVSPKTEAVFKGNPNAKPTPVKTREDMQRGRNRYYGTADSMERQNKRVAERIAEAQREDEENGAGFLDD